MDDSSLSQEDLVIGARAPRPSPPAPASAEPPRSALRRWLPWTLAAGVAVVAGAAFWYRSVYLTRGPDPQALELYTRATSIPLIDESRLRQAMALEEQAVARDPRFARAIAALALTRTSFVAFGYSLPGALDKAEREARLALELDPRLPDAHSALGVVSAYRTDWLASDTAFRRALELDPQNLDCEKMKALVFTPSVGHLQAAADDLRRVHRNSPEMPALLAQLALAYSRLELDSMALQYARRAEELGYPATQSPLPQVYANAALHEGSYEEAAERALGGMPSSLRSAQNDAAVRAAYKAMAKSSAEENARAAEGLRALQKSDGSSAISHSLIAWYTALGALDDAYAIAEESLRNAQTTQPSGTAWGGIWTQNMRTFRQDGRFQGLVARLHFMPYWKANGQPNDCEISGDELICK